jgi:hypothetical protein
MLAGIEDGQRVRDVEGKWGQEMNGVDGRFARIALKLATETPGFSSVTRLVASGLGSQMVT